VCEDCGAQLHDPFAPDAATALPKGTWSYIRLQYGARRGMIVRVLAFLLGPVVFGLLAREAITRPYAPLGIAGAFVAGVATSAIIYWFAGRAVRIWVLRKGQLHKRRMARALMRRAFK
jgi:hypothetical protein